MSTETTTETTARVQLIDSADEPGRTTATLVASLAARLGVLHLMSGADAVGAMTAGFAALGRVVSQTAEGARLREALEAGRAGTNGDALWKSLHIEEWISSMPPSPVLEQLRNDVALLLADDLEDTLQLMPIPGQTVGAQGAKEPQPVTFIDCLLGLWAYSSEVLRSVEALAALAATPREVVDAEKPDPESEGTLLR
jgi:hypothetical protein